MKRAKNAFFTHLFCVEMYATFIHPPLLPQLICICIYPFISAPPAGSRSSYKSFPSLFIIQTRGVVFTLHRLGGTTGQQNQSSTDERALPDKRNRQTSNTSGLGTSSSLLSRSLRFIQPRRSGASTGTKNHFIPCLVCVLVLKPTFTPSGCRLTESGSWG